MDAVFGDMALFLWLILFEPMVATVAAATAITVVIVIASFFNFLLSANKGVFSNDRT